MSKISDLEYRQKATGKDESRKLYFSVYCRSQREHLTEKTPAGVEPVRKVITIGKEQ
jgi:hypothetical protein